MYAENIDQCLEKLKEAARNAREKKVVMIKQVQLVMIEDQRHDGDEVVRQLYLDPVDIECFGFKENLKTIARTCLRAKTISLTVYRLSPTRL